MDLLILIKTLVLLLATTTTPAFIFKPTGDHGTTPSDCMYTETSIDCVGGGLKDVPKFKAAVPSDNISDFNINLLYNSISTVPTNVFRNIILTNGTWLHVNLAENQIVAVSESAFDSVETNIVSLDLSGNKLQTIPPCISKLINLKTFYFGYNPLSHLDSNVLSNISNTLERFSFSMNLFTSWPRSLSMLPVLKRLTIIGEPFSSLPHNAFDGLESTLAYLTISHSNLTQLPQTVCTLQHLEALYFEHTVLQNNSIVDPCTPMLAHLTYIDLIHTNLTAFPDILHTIPTVLALILQHNCISFVPSDLIPTSSHVDYLDLSHNVLTRIPFALNKLTNLKYLFLHNNNIHTVETNDLYGLSNLRELYLFSNPIQYIATHVFDNNTKLSYLDLESTNLQLIPESVIHLPSLIHFDFSHNNVDCSCDMSYLDGWNVSSVTRFLGKCSSPIKLTIKQFILNELNRCHSSIHQ